MADGGAGGIGSGGHNASNSDGDASDEVKVWTRDDTKYPSSGVISSMETASMPDRSRNSSPNAAHVAVENNAVGTDIIPTVDASEAVNAGDTMKKEDLLCFINAMTNWLPTICLGTLGLSVIYSILQMLLGNKTGIWIDVIHAGGIMTYISSFILAKHASYLKHSKSIEGYGHATFKWPLLLVMGYHYAVFCIIILQPFTNNTPDWDLWMIGSIGLGPIIVVGYWFWFFHKKLPKILEEINTGYVGENERDV